MRQAQSQQMLVLEWGRGSLCNRPQGVDAIVEITVGIVWNDEMAEGGVSAINTAVDDQNRGAGYPNVGGCTTRPEWRPDSRVLEECSDDQITRVRS